MNPALFCPNCHAALVWQSDRVITCQNCGASPDTPAEWGAHDTPDLPGETEEDDKWQK